MAVQQGIDPKQEGVGCGGGGGVGVGQGKLLPVVRGYFLLVSDQVMNAQFKFADTKRFDQVVVGTLLQAVDAALLPTSSAALADRIMTAMWSVWGLPLMR